MKSDIASRWGPYATNRCRDCTQHKNNRAAKVEKRDHPTQITVRSWSNRHLDAFLHMSTLLPFSHASLRMRSPLWFGRFDVDIQTRAMSLISFDQSFSTATARTASQSFKRWFFLASLLWDPFHSFSVKLSPFFPVLSQPTAPFQKRLASRITSASLWTAEHSSKLSFQFFARLQREKPMYSLRSSDIARRYSSLSWLSFELLCQVARSSQFRVPAS